MTIRILVGAIIPLITIAAFTINIVIGNYAVASVCVIIGTGGFILTQVLR